MQLFEIYNDLFEQRKLKSLLAPSKKLTKQALASFDDVIKFALKDKKPIRVGKIAVESGDDLVRVIRSGKLSRHQSGKVVTYLLKSPNTPQEILPIVADDLVNSIEFIRKYTKYPTKKELTSALKNSGYTADAAKTLSDQAMSNTKFVNSIGKYGDELGKTSKRSKPISPGAKTKTKTPKIKKPKGKFRVRVNGVVAKYKWKFIGSLILSGVLVGLTTYTRKKILDRISNEEKYDWPPCLLKVLQHVGTSVDSTTTGYPVVVVPKTNNEKYNQQGGLIFYLNGSVTSLNGNLKGTWVCKNEIGTIREGLSLTESWFGGNKVDADDMDDYINKVIEYVSGKITLKDVKRLNGIITTLSDKTYNGVDAVSVLYSQYTKSTGRDLLSDVKIIKSENNPFEVKEYVNNIIKILSKDKYVGDSADSEDIGDVNLRLNQPLGNVVPVDSYIQILWPGGGKQGKSGDHDTKTDDGRPKYSPCRDFPFRYGCVNDKIEELQKCLGLEKHNLTGQYDKSTHDKLVKSKYNMSGGITKKIYDDVIKKCQPKLAKISSIPIQNVSMPDDVIKKCQPKLAKISSKPIQKVSTPSTKKEG